MSPKASVEAIVEAALRLPPEQRAACVSEACGDDTPLRQRVEALLQEREQGGGVVDKATVLAGTIALSFPPAKIPLAYKPGDKIGRYTLLEEIGEGGMGTVWKAEQTGPVRLTVALKVIKLGMDTKEVIARFERERQALALMDHANIAKVFDAGATDTGRPYFVMELVAGIPITRFCDEQNLSTTERLKLFGEVCHAIQHAHQKGVIHRDIKPSNILVSLQESTPVPKVIDFGIAKATDQRLTDKTLVTALDQIIGTPAYMSPEQAGLSGLDIDTRSDIYSLGVLLYELLTGKTPFDPKRLFEAGLEEIRRIIRQEEPPRPSTRFSDLTADEQTTTAKRRDTDPPRLLHLVRGDLDWIVMKCLEKDRTRRYETANGLAADLQRHLQDEPVVARPPSNLYQLQKLVRRNKLAFTAATLVAGAVILGLAGTSWQALRATRAQRIANQQRQRAESEAKRADLNAQGERSQRELAERRLAQSLIAQGDTSSLVGELTQAKGYYTEAGEMLRRFDGASLAADIPLSLVLGAAPRPLRSYPVGKSAIIGLAWQGDGHSVCAALADGSFQVCDLLTGQAARTFGVASDEKAGAVAFSLDGTLAVQSKYPEPIRLWDAAKGEVLRPFEQHGGVLTSLAFSRDGKVVMAGDMEGHISLFAIASGEIRSKVKAHRGYTWAVAFSPDGTTAASGGEDGLVKLWSTADLQEKTVLRGHTWYVTSVAISTDGRRVLSGSADKTARLWDATTGTQLALITQGALIRDVSFAPEPGQVIVGGEDQTLRIWDPRIGRLVRTLTGAKGGISSIALPAQSRVIAGDDTGAMYLWSLNGGKVPDYLTGHEGAAKSIALSPDGRLAASGGADCIIQIWDLASGKSLMQLTGHSDFISCVAFSPDGLKLASAGTDGPIRLWDLASRRVLTTFAGHDTIITARADGKDGRVGEVVTSGPSKIDITIGATEERYQGVQRHASAVNSVAFFPDGERLVSGSDDGTIRIWDVQNGHSLKSLDAKGRGVKQVTVSRDGRWILSAHGDGKLRRWAAQSCELVSAHDAHTGGVLAVAISSDDTAALSAGRDGTIKRWELSSGKLLQTFPCPQREVRAVLFLNKVSMVAAASANGEIAFWEPPNTRPQRTLRPHLRPINALAASSSGELLLTASEDGTVGVYDFTFGRSAQSSANEVNTTASPSAFRQLLANSLLFSQGRCDDWALELLQEVQAGRAEHVSPLTVAQICLRSGDRQGAAAAFKEALKVATTDQRDYLLLCVAATSSENRMVDRSTGSVSPVSKITPPDLTQRSKDVPPRAPYTKPNLIDLSGQYNVSLAETWHQNSGRSDLSEVPRGVQKFGGIEFDVRALIQVGFQAVNGEPYPKEVSGIAVHRRCQRLHFLHSAINAFSVPHGIEIGHYLVHYADGREGKLPLVIGRDLGDWFEQPQEPKAQWEVVWTGTNESSRAQGRKIRLFKTTWENPRPDAVIETIDVVSTKEVAAPFVVAITAEPE